MINDVLHIPECLYIGFSEYCDMIEFSENSDGRLKKTQDVDDC